MTYTLKVIEQHLRDEFDFEVEFIPFGYLPLQIDSEGVVDLNPCTPRVDVLQLSRNGKVYIEIYSLNPHCISFNASGFPSRSGYDEFFIEMVRICSKHYFPICTTAHHLTESNRLARSKATIKAHQRGYDIGFVRTNSAQLIGFLPKRMLNSYNGDLEYIGSPQATHIKLSVRGIRTLTLAACILDMLPNGLKVIVLKLAHKSLSRHRSLVK